MKIILIIIVWIHSCTKRMKDPVHKHFNVLVQWAISLNLVHTKYLHLYSPEIMFERLFFAGLFISCRVPEGLWDVKKGFKSQQMSSKIFLWEQSHAIITKHQLLGVHHITLFVKFSGKSPHGPLGVCSVCTLKKYPVSVTQAQHYSTESATGVISGRFQLTSDLCLLLSLLHVHRAPPW